MAIDRETVRATAALARLALSAAEIERAARDLSAVLDYVARLDDLGLPGDAPATSLHERSAPPRADAVRLPRLDRAEALAQAPATDGVHFLVPPMLERPGR